MRKLVGFSILMISFSELFAQKDYTVTAVDTSVIINYIPKYSWTVGIEYSYVTQIFQSPATYYPDNFEVEWWIKNRLYGEAGIHLYSQYHKSTGNEYEGFSTYAGATFKLFMFRNAYFTPAWSIYFEPNSNSSDTVGSFLGTGPTAAFEYFIKNRLSFRLDLVNLTFGYHFSPDPGESGTKITTYRVLGLGVRYNFDLRKAK